MARLRTAAAVFAIGGGVAGAIAVGGFALVGCGDTSPSPSDDGGADQSVEAASDVKQPDTGGDAKAGADVATDSRVGDGGAGSDADVTLADAGSDGDARGVGVDADAGLGDGGLASDADAAITVDGADAKVIPPGLLAYPGQYTTAICTAFAACCGATFDVAACKAALNNQGYDNTLPLNPSTYGNGNLTFSQTQAAACVTALQAWPCGATITSAQNQAILTACHGVLGGTVAIGGGCISSFECVTGAFCANGGICTALVGAGGTCITGESPDFQCSHIATAVPARYCTLYPADGSTSSGTGTCQTVQANGAGSLCSDLSTAYSDYACTGQLCDFAATGNCVAVTANPAAAGTGFECRNFVIRDAGGG